MRIKQLFPILGVLAITGAAVTVSPGVAQVTTQQEITDRDIRVTVKNSNWADVRVYAVSSSYTVRLGTVSGLGEATFKVPRSLPIHSGEFQLAIRPIGSRGVHYSQPILVSAGDVVEFRVHNHLGLSNAIVY